MHFKVIKDIYNYFPLIYVLSKRDFHAKLIDAKLGLLWIILPALLPIGAYVTMAIIGMKNLAVGMPFAIYISTGFTLYMFMNSFIKATIKSYDDKVLLKTYNLPIVVVVLIKNQTTFIDFFVRFLFLVGIYIYFNIQITFTLFLLPILLLIIIMFSFSIGIFAGFLNIFYKDIGQLFTLFLRYGLFVSSVIFPFPTEGWLGIVANLNVFNTYVNNIRNIIVLGIETAYNGVFIVTLLMTLLLYILAIVFLNNKEYQIKELL